MPLSRTICFLSFNQSTKLNADARDPFLQDWLTDQYRQHGGTVLVPIPFDSLTYVADPRCVEHMLKTNFKNYPKVSPFKLELRTQIVSFCGFAVTLCF